MKKVTRQKTVSEDFYIAEDGTEFTSEGACITYEFRLKLTPVYVVQVPVTCGGGVEVFSTKAMAEESLKNVRGRSYYRIEEVFLDERVLRDRGEI